MPNNEGLISRWFEQLGHNLVDYNSTLLVQHHGLVNSEILDLTFVLEANTSSVVCLLTELSGGIGLI
jgi:hypothetical protein